LTIGNADDISAAAERQPSARSNFKVQLGTVSSPARGPFSLEGRVAIVTGGGLSGPEINIGHAIAVTLANAGAGVVVGDRDETAARATVEKIEAAGGTASACMADVTVEKDGARLVAAAVDGYGRLDIVVNNVAIITARQAVTDVVEKDWDEVMAVNVKSIALVCKAAIPAMSAGGAIVGISSISVERPSIWTAYAASKAAVEGLIKAMAVQVAARGIRANCIRVGEIWTPMVARLYSTESGAEVKEMFRRGPALGAGTAWDVAGAVLFMVSDASRWITGQVLTVDGGGGLLRPQTVMENSARTS
jgi:NAD(P)-dependent dehydrogenase (short-subunit alcohol dehydrogenase family)